MTSPIVAGDRVIETRFPEEQGVVLGIIRLTGMIESGPIAVIRWDQTNPDFISGSWLPLEEVTKIDETPSNPDT